MNYLSAKETAEKWNITVRQVQKLCKTGRIEGAQRLGNGKVWVIPKEVEKPIDRRIRGNVYQQSGIKNKVME